jgi:hypothetical protein
MEFGVVRGMYFCQISHPGHPLALSLGGSVALSRRLVAVPVDEAPAVFVFEVALLLTLNLRPPSLTKQNTWN